MKEHVRVKSCVGRELADERIRYARVGYKVKISTDAGLLMERIHLNFGKTIRNKVYLLNPLMSL